MYAIWDSRFDSALIFDSTAAKLAGVRGTNDPVKRKQNECKKLQTRNDCLLPAFTIAEFSAVWKSITFLRVVLKDSSINSGFKSGILTFGKLGNDVIVTFFSWLGRRTVVDDSVVDDDVDGTKVVGLVVCTVRADP